MDRRSLLRTALSIGVVGTVGCTAGGTSRQISPPPVVDDWAVTPLPSRKAKPERAGDPPRIDCATARSVQIGGWIGKKPANSVVVESMTLDDGTFELVVGLDEQEGEKILEVIGYEASVTFGEMPGRISVLETGVEGSVSQKIDCRKE